MEREFYRYLLLAWSAAAVVCFAVLWRLPAPYGRNFREGWGSALPRTAAWALMELPALLLFSFFYVASERGSDPAAVAFFLLWTLHYANRALIYPFRLRGNEPRMPAAVAAMAFFFNVVNGYLQGRWLFWLGPARGAGWLADPRFIAGTLLFLAGYALNQHSDALLRKLRPTGESAYKIPRGGAFRWVSCPNYLGELVEWLGWALLTWSAAGAAFFLWSAANLAPRARSHHRFYRERFPDYPAGRKALIPGVY